VFKTKRWIIVGVVAAVIVLVAGVVGVAVVSAQSPTPSPSAAANSPGKAFADRVAGILGVDSAKVEAAFTQAAKDMQNDALKARLDAAVKAGKMTQAQEDQYLQWWKSRPNVQIGPGGNMGPMMGGAGPRGGFHGMPGPGFAKPFPAASPIPSPSGTK
jgi:hypothetical protein